MSGKKKI